MSLEPLYVDSMALRSAVGAIVNVRNRHWVALRFIDEQVWLLDSQNAAPVPLSWAMYESFIRQHRAAYRINVAEGWEMHPEPWT